MPKILDNIEQHLLPVLNDTLAVSERADFCVGYFNLRGWRHVDSYIERWAGGDGHCCRLLVGMQRLAGEEFRTAMSFGKRPTEIDHATALRLRRQLAFEFRTQLTVGLPTADDEAGLRRLAHQIRASKVVVKLYLRHNLHAKLYLLFRPDLVNPRVGFLGSSNLTLAGLSGQGELNIDVMDGDATEKLARWFEDRWNDRYCVDISAELAQIIEESWARTTSVPPYHIYIKMAYHLSQEARSGLSQFRIPTDFGDQLFEFQKAAVKIAAHHINRRGGVLIGDVVGLGKTLMATAVARILEDDYGLETLIVCPRNLVSMWEDYRVGYRLRAKVISITNVQNELPDLRRFRLVIVDESHNLRNREGKRYRALAEYIQANDSRVILLSATPYNKTYLDLSSQLRLFVPEDTDIGIRPERALREIGETEFIRRHQCPIRSLAAFDKSEYADDWRDLMRLYLVRRTRTFIRQNYALKDETNGRQYLVFADGTRSYFPDRLPLTVKFRITEKRGGDQYARLFSTEVVDAVNALALPRYGLGNYQRSTPGKPPTSDEARVLQDLSRAGIRLKGFCRTNLYKRLESSGYAFVLSVRRHVLRNFIYLYAIAKGLPLPIGTQDMGLLDTRYTDFDSELADAEEDGGGAPRSLNGPDAAEPHAERQFMDRAAEVYAIYRSQYARRFKWLRPDLFEKTLSSDLRKDAESLMGVLDSCGDWDPDRDAKLLALVDLVRRRHPTDKVLVFTQFADTVQYLTRQLGAAGVERLSGVTGDSEDPTAIAWRFSPVSNERRERVKPKDELRVVVATDVLSEGQNLQDCCVVVNYDLPWAIIRLIQRAGRVDRIGQTSETITCYSFLPADGVERIIRLRRRVRERLRQNAEVVGTDEAFFDDDVSDQPLVDLYNEKAGILDGDDEGEVDLASYAYQIWKNATDADPGLARVVSSMPDVVYSTRTHVPTAEEPDGVLVYLRSGDGTDALNWVDASGKDVTQSQLAILKAAACRADTPAIERFANHHDLVRVAAEAIAQDEKSTGGQLGRPSGARFRTYERLKRHLDSVRATLFDTPELSRAVEDMYRFPLLQSAVDTLNRQLKSGIADQELAELVVGLREDNRLCRAPDDEESEEPQIICSLGLRRVIEKGKQE